MTSTVTADLPASTCLVDIFKALFPCGSITGAPKIAAMSAIAALEANSRGPYCGAVGVIEPGGAAHFSVGIRTLEIIAEEVQCGIGGGITSLSKAELEFEECLMKRRFLFRACAAFSIFETMRLEEGQTLRADRHLARLSRSARHFGFPYDRIKALEMLEAVAAANPSGQHRLRLTLDRTGALTLEKSAFPETPKDPLVVLATRPIRADFDLLRHKTNDRRPYEKLEQKDAPYFDTLLYNETDELTEFCRGNLAVEYGGVLTTPPECAGLLPGVLRAEMLDAGRLREGIVRRSDLDRCGAIYFLNSLRGLVRVYPAWAQSRT